MEQHIPTDRPAKPGRVLKLSASYERAVRGPVRKPQAIAEIEITAALVYATSTAEGSVTAFAEKQREGRR